MPADLMDTDVCDDCGQEVMCSHEGHDTEWYMVVDEIWPAGAQFLCIGCLQVRVGRALTRADFTDVPLNDATHYRGRYAYTWRSARLQALLTEGAEW